MERLRSHRDFVAVLQHRRKVASGDIVAHYWIAPRRAASHEVAPAPMAARRCGLAVAKSVGNAVARNAVKRRFRVLARRYEGMLPEQCDVVLRAKPSAAGAQFASLETQFAALFGAIAARDAQLKAPLKTQLKTQRCEEHRECAAAIRGREPARGSAA